MSSMGYEAKNNLTDLFVFQGKLFFKDHFYFEFQSQCFARTGIQKRNLKIRKKTKRQADATSSFTIKRDSISAKLGYTLLCYSWFYL